MKLSKSVKNQFLAVTPLSKFIALLCFILFPFFGFYLGMQYQRIVLDTDIQIENYKWDAYKQETQTTPAVIGVYEGTLPCADCEAINTKISFSVDNQSKAPRTFSMTEVYQGKSEMPVEKMGTWNMLKGTKKDDEAFVYQLNVDNSYEPLYFLKVNDTTIMMLDKNMAELKSKLNYTLTKQ